LKEIDTRRSQDRRRPCQGRQLAENA